MSSLSYFFTKFAAKVLDFDHTALPEQQFAMIQDVLANETIQIKGTKAKELLSCLKRKHLVNSITVRRIKNGAVFSSSGNGQAESKSASDLMRFATKNFATADIITMRTEKDWVMLMPFEESIYIVKANSCLSTIELKAIAREIEFELKKRHIS